MTKDQKKQTEDIDKTSSDEIKPIEEPSDRKSEKAPELSYQTLDAEKEEHNSSFQKAIGANEGLQNLILEQLNAINTRLINVEVASKGQQSNARVIEEASQFYAPPQHCSCNQGKCCCFDVFISRARVIKRQGLPELADGGGPNPRRNLEMIFHVVANGMSGIYPSLNSHMQISERSGWASINKKITQISVNGSKQIPVMVEAREVETKPAGGRAEYGSSNEVYLNLSCGCPVIPLQIEVDLIGGGVAGGTVEVEVTARETCCEIC